MDARPIARKPGTGATQRERDQFFQDLKRSARKAEGRCRYCGRYPEPGRKACVRCLEIARRNAAVRRERMRAKREAERRAALPRRCAGCGSGNLKKGGWLRGRQRYACRDCGRHSYGDGISAEPSPAYPCPYCGGQCRKRGHELRVKRRPPVFTCTVCGKWNTNLWPANAPSPGGPFPHRKRFLISYLAQAALMAYCQAHKMSQAQAIRDIFTRAGTTPPPRGTSRAGLPGVKSIPSLCHGTASSVTTAALPTIPPGGVRFPSAFPEASAKLIQRRSGRGFQPTVLVAQVYSVCLNDAALAGLLETMRRRGLNHQDAARALIVETAVPAPIIMSVPRDDGELDGR